MSLSYEPLFITGYEGDAAHLSLEEDDIYNRLPRPCRRAPGCSIPDDAAWIGAVGGVRTDHMPARRNARADEIEAFAAAWLPAVNCANRAGGSQYSFKFYMKNLNEEIQCNIV